MNDISDLSGRREFSNLVTILENRLNVDQADVIELVCQYIITKPILAYIFPDAKFSNQLNDAIDLVADQLRVDLSDIEEFYSEVKKYADEINDDAERQQLIITIYQDFLHVGFPRMCAKLGIVYTPIEVVDFILNSVDSICRNEFGVGIGDGSVSVTDPFTGTGLFITRLIESELISDDDLERKYNGEIFANEIVPLAYMLAGINIESSYRARTSEHKSFTGLELVDTFLT